LNPLAISLQAGFWEECLFRAVPLAGAALLGERFGRRRAWIAAAFIVQILIFGAAHANYPAQPAYARIVELILPSAVFGLLYLRFGLLPAIVLHFAFDAVLFSLPLFLPTASGAWIDQGLFAVIFLLPIWVVLHGSRRPSRCTTAPGSHPGPNRAQRCLRPRRCRSLRCRVCRSLQPSPWPVWRSGHTRE
ncbi:MAG: CPBP family intramembrane metalloprotease, partial [Alphaproteobacteria bacterium]|nr:CPBP family intramembrane metalloprotease [Alphaproteobacteria bacterium]